MELKEKENNDTYGILVFFLFPLIISQWSQKDSLNKENLASTFNNGDPYKVWIIMNKQDQIL